MTVGLFQVALRRAAAPARLAVFVALLAIVDRLSTGGEVPGDGRDLDAAPLAWLGLGLVAVLFVAPAAWTWSTWRSSARHWFAPRPLHPARWFAASAGAALAASCLGMALVMAIIGRHAVTRPPLERVDVLVVERERSSAEPRRIELDRVGADTLRPEPRSVHLELRTLQGTGSTPTIELAAGDRTQRYVVAGRKTLEVPIAAATSALELAQIDGTALVIFPTRPPEVFVGGASRFGVLGAFGAVIALWSILPLGLTFALGRFLRPSIALGASLAITLPLGLAPLGGVRDAIHLLEWNAFDVGLIVAEVPRALLGLVLLAAASFGTNGGTRS